MSAPVPDRPHWDAVPIGDTTPAKAAGGVPFWAYIGSFFVPAVVCVLTMNALWLAWIPSCLIAFRLALLNNPNRPREWWLYFRSGSFFADWRAWGGDTHDPHDGGNPWGGLHAR